MSEGEPSIQRSSGGTEAERRQDGTGRRETLPGSEASRGNVEPEVDAPAPEKLLRDIPAAGIQVEESSGTAFAETALDAKDQAKDAS